MAAKAKTEFTIYRLTNASEKSDPLRGNDKIEFDETNGAIRITDVTVSPHSPPAETQNPSSQEPNFKEDTGVSKITITINGHIDMQNANAKNISEKCRQWLVEEKENTNYKTGRFGFNSKKDFAEYNLIPGVAKGYMLVYFEKKIEYEIKNRKNFVMILEIGAGVASLGEALPK